MRNTGLINGIPFDIQMRLNVRGSRERRRDPTRFFVILFSVFLASVLVLVGLHMVMSQKADGHKASALGPSLPYILYGYTYDSSSDPIGPANVTITNEDTGGICETATDVNGYYQFNLANLPNGYSVGDTISIVGNTTESTGYNSTTVTGSGGKWLNITLNVSIPEFSSVLAPIGGMMIVSVAPMIQRRIRTKRDCSH